MHKKANIDKGRNMYIYIYMYIQAWNTYSYIFEDTHLHTRIKHFGMHTGNHILYM